MSTAPATGTDRSEWVRCRGCAVLVYGKRLDRSLGVCPECGTHHAVTAPERLAQLLDPGTFAVLPGTVRSEDRLGFTDTKPYPERLAAARRASGLSEAVICGTGQLDGHRLAIAVMDFRFMGGSLGTAVGELVTRTAETALAQRLPLLIVTASGGARMQEGVLSLMQMAKTSAVLSRMNEAGLLTVSLITDPTYGGVAASYATCTDVIIAETGARLGFAGPRVVAQTIREELPPGFQTAEFLFARGMIDRCEDRGALRGSLSRLLTAASPAPSGRPGVGDAAGGVPDAPAVIRDPETLPAGDTWGTVKRARETGRPTTLDYLNRTFDSFLELHGDRTGGDSPSIVAGIATLEGRPVMVLGHQKGHTTRELLDRNFGMPGPEGYRKAVRLMRLAAKLRLPVITLVDTPGAHPGVAAEENGQALAVSASILEMAGLRTPVVTVLTGEGGSGGALALAVADRVLMLEHSTYSVISPEGCSAILWGTAASAPAAAAALRITAADLLTLEVVDGVVPEPPGGAHRSPAAAADNLRRALGETLAEVLDTGEDELVEARRNRFRAFGTDEPIALPTVSGMK